MCRVVAYALFAIEFPIMTPAQFKQSLLVPDTKDREFFAPGHKTTQ